MLATATHDHKRGEDSRARLAALSEFSAEWSELVRNWLERSGAFKTAVDGEPVPRPADELMLYQTIVGAWPLDDREGPSGQAFRDRIHAWQVKSLREGKERSSWEAPAAEYETACRAFLERLLDSAFAAECEGFVGRLSIAGAMNSLVQTALHLTLPGVPDLYQGTEFWDFSLVDPDNRRPVDWAGRQRSLDAESSLPDLLRGWQDGHVKQKLVALLLQLRRDHPDLFADGDYRPLKVSGRHASRLLGFERRAGGSLLVVVVPVHAAKLLGESDLPLVPAVGWEDTIVHLPRGRGLVDTLCNRGGVGSGAASELLKPFPVAVLFGS
jgi:(1->4)-alpha-D-glucan 1-alpha-D-glucosylmutase